MGLTPTEKNAMLDGRSGGWGFASLHTADPSTTGANEVTGGTPAYARKAVTWASGAGGAVASVTSGQTLDVPAGTDVLFVGLFSAVTAGTFRGFGPACASLTNPMVFTAAASTDILTVPGSSLTNGQQVMVIDTGGSVLPTGLAENTVYYVVNVSGATFKLAATSGGTAIDLTADGAGHVVAVSVEHFTGQGQYVLAAGNIVVDLLAVT